VDDECLILPSSFKHLVHFSEYAVIRPLNFIAWLVALPYNDAQLRSHLSSALEYSRRSGYAPRHLQWLDRWLKGDLQRC
jgi:hypothetical protein